MKIQGIMRNQRGDLSFFSVFVVLAINIILAGVLMYASIQINCINVRNAIKMEMNNLAASLYADTYNAQREADLDSYFAQLYSSSTYVEAMKERVIEELQRKIDLSNETYHLSNFQLEFHQKPGRIEYVCSCDAVFTISMFGGDRPLVTQEISLNGYHNTKY